MENHEGEPAPEPEGAPVLEPASESEILVEQEPLRESIETVAELLEHWKEEYDATDDGDRKRELAYRLVKMGEALSASGLSASDVTIRESEPGVLGFYVPATGEISITPSGLNLPAEHFEDVLVHEATHAGITTGKKVGDEGLTQIITRQKVSGAMHGIYESEQKEVHTALDKVEISSVIDTYDFDNPRELIELYLDVEWEDEWKRKLAAELTDDARVATDEGRKEILEGELKDWVTTLNNNLEKAVPRLYEKAKVEGFDFSKAHASIFEEKVSGTNEAQVLNAA